MDVFAFLPEGLDHGLDGVSLQCNHRLSTGSWNLTKKGGGSSFARLDERLMKEGIYAVR
jgi:hypothetical protein